MSIAVVTTFKVNRDQALRLVGQAAPAMKRHGASSVRVGLCHAGSRTGTISVVLTFPDWQSYGKAAQSMQEDQPYQAILAEAMKAGELVDRSIMVMQDM